MLPELVTVRFPSNCKFVKADMTKLPLPFESNEFDCVQIRINPPVRDREALYADIHRILKPGGFLQLIDISNMIPAMSEDPPIIFKKIDRLIATLLGAKETYNEKYWTIDPNYPGILEGAVHRETEKILWDYVEFGYLPLPISAWPGANTKEREIGQDMAEAMCLLWEGFKPFLLNSEILNEDEFKEIAKDFKETLTSHSPPKGVWKYTTRLARKNSTL